MKDPTQNLRYELKLQCAVLIRVERLKDAQAAHDQTVKQAALDLEARRERIADEYAEHTRQIYLNFAIGDGTPVNAADVTTEIGGW